MSLEHPRKMPERVPLARPLSDSKMRAMTKATRTRVLRAELKRQMRAGETLFVDVMAGHDEWEPWVRNMRIDTLLMAVPGVGEVTKNDVLEALKLEGRVVLQAMTFERRGEIARLVAYALNPDPAFDPDGRP